MDFFQRLISGQRTIRDICKKQAEERKRAAKNRGNFEDVASDSEFFDDIVLDNGVSCKSNFGAILDFFICFGEGLLNFLGIKT